MSISEFGAIGELVGALAVIVTIAYLARQIRLAQRTMVSTTQQNISDISSQLFAAAATSDGLAEAFAKAGRGDPLDEAEQWRITGWWSAVLRHAENMHYQWEQGMLATELFDTSMKRIAAGLESTPIALAHWRAVSRNHRPGFAKWLDAAIEDEMESRDR